MILYVVWIVVLICWSVHLMLKSNAEHRESEDRLKQLGKKD